jgi:hypothetical protein
VSENHNEKSHGEHGAPAAAEADKPRSALIFAAVVATAIILVALLAGINELFDHTMRSTVSRQQLDVPSSQLRDLRAKEAARLTRYQWVNKTTGELRIPVDRAAQLVLAERSAKPSGATGIEDKGAARDGEK